MEDSRPLTMQLQDRANWRDRMRYVAGLVVPRDTAQLLADLQAHVRDLRHEEHAAEDLGALYLARAKASQIVTFDSTYSLGLAIQARQAAARIRYHTDRLEVDVQKLAAALAGAGEPK